SDPFRFWRPICVHLMAPNLTGVHRPAGSAEIAAGHILPHEYTDTVAMAIPTCRLDFDMLANHIETHFLGLDDVILERFITRRRMQAVCPPTLIQWTILRDKFVVEHDALHAICIFGHTYFPHGEVAVDVINRFALAKNLDL